MSVFLTVLAVLIAACAVLADGLYRISLLPKSRSKQKRDRRAVPAPQQSIRQILIDGRTWLLEQSDCKSVKQLSRDGLTLHAYYLPRPSHRWAVCVHGYWDSAEGMGYWARHYAQQGWNCLLPDLRGHGLSEGTYVGMGWPDRLDLLVWVDWILQRDPQAEIVLHGVSMGAATVLMATGESLPPNVKAAVSDCAFSCAYDEFRYVAEKRLNLRIPFPLLIGLLRLAALFRAGYDIRKASAVAQAAHSVTPTLFIHGKEDRFVPPDMLERIYDAAACPKQKLLVPDADHTAAAPTHPELYWRTVDNFLTPYLNGGIHS